MFHLQDVAEHRPTLDLNTDFGSGQHYNHEQVYANSTNFYAAPGMLDSDVQNQGPGGMFTSMLYSPGMDVDIFDQWLAHNSIDATFTAPPQGYQAVPYQGHETPGDSHHHHTNNMSHSPPVVFGPTLSPPSSTDDDDLPFNYYSNNNNNNNNSDAPSVDGYEFEAMDEGSGE